MFKHALQMLLPAINKQHRVTVFNKSLNYFLRLSHRLYYYWHSIACVAHFIQHFFKMLA